MQLPMAFARVDDLMLLMHGREKPAQEKWSEYVAFVEATQKSASPVTALLVVSDGGGPNATQRNQIIAAFSPKGTPVAV